MALPVLPYCFRTVSRFTPIASGKPWSVTMDFRRSLQTGGLSAQDVADRMVSQWQDLFATTVGTNTTIATYFDDATSLDEVQVYDLDPDPGPDGLTAATGVDGEATVDPMPAEVAICITKRTATRGRAGRGRMYLGGLSGTAGDADGFLPGLLTAALVSGFEEHFRQFDVELGDNLSMIVISQYASVSPPGPPYLPTTYSDVLDLTVDNRFDTQRRRGVR